MLAEHSTCQALPVRTRSDETRLLLVYQSRSGETQRLVDAAADGIRAALTAVDTESADTPPSIRKALDVKHAFDATKEDVLEASGVLLASPANFGYMSGAMKDFFERIYHPCLEKTVGLPYTMIVKGDTDVEGAAASIDRIAIGLRWRKVLPEVLVVGKTTPEHLGQAFELGATLAAGLDSGIF
jgi:NAD(P)H-dependent FMN reductase